MSKTIYFKQESDHRPEWYWSGEKQDMVCRCTCGGPLDCDRNVAVNAWSDHVQAISDFLANGGLEDLKDRNATEINDLFYELIELDT